MSSTPAAGPALGTSKSIAVDGTIDPTIGISIAAGVISRPIASNHGAKAKATTQAAIVLEAPTKIDLNRRPIFFGGLTLS